MSDRDIEREKEIRQQKAEIAISVLESVQKRISGTCPEYHAECVADELLWWKNVRDGKPNC